MVEKVVGSSWSQRLVSSNAVNFHQHGSLGSRSRLPSLSEVPETHKKKRILSRHAVLYCLELPLNMALVTDLECSTSLF